MLETVVSSSILIAVIILLRYIFRGRIDQRLQYGLLLLVAVRLLLPFSITVSSISIMNVIATENKPVYIERFVDASPAGYSAVTEAEAMNETEASNPSAMPPETVSSSNAGSAAGTAAAISAKDIPNIVWLAGAASVGIWFAAQNIRFYMRLKRSRKPVKVTSGGLTVYTSRTITSPCLFGLLRPAVYIPPDSLTYARTAEYILIHEETHFRHLDHIWAFLRCICIALHWFNPFVWWAAALSRRDCELACDESALNRLGDEHRKAYENMLIDMITRRLKPSDLLCGATTMTSGKKGITERIMMIAKRLKMLLQTLTAVILVLALATGCTFTGAKQAKAEPLTSEELAYFNGDEFFNGDAVNIRNQFLCSIYESPEKIDLYQLLYNSGELATEFERAAVITRNGWDAEPDTGCFKISGKEIDAVLTEYMGLTLSETEKKVLKTSHILKSTIHITAITETPITGRA